MGHLISFLRSFRALAVSFGMVSLIAAGLVRFFLPKIPNAATGLLILGCLLLVLYILGAGHEIKNFLLSKHGKYSANTAIMVIIFMAIMILANYLGFTNHKRFDLTASSKFTLAPQTQRVIRELKEPVTILGFFPNVAQFKAAQKATENLLDEYRYFNRKLTYQFIDPDTKPTEAKKYNVKQSGAIVFVAGKRMKQVAAITEQDFTGALLEVTGVEAKKIYFLSGHGERDINNRRQDGYAAARMGLIRDLYKVETLNLSITPKVPEDCAVLIIAGPKNDYLAQEQEALLSYMKAQGKVLFLLDPGAPAQIMEILAHWGLTMGNGRVVDRNAFISPDVGVPAVFRDKYPPLVITRGLDTTYYPDASAVNLTSDLSRVLESMKSKDKPTPGWPLSPVQFDSLAILPALISSGYSWLETDNKIIKYDANFDQAGPLAMGALVVASSTLGEESPASSGREDKLTKMVIIGDSDFASNAHIQNGGNGDLFVNSVNWLAEEEHLISIRPKPFTFRRLVVSKDAARFIRYSSVALLPFLVLIMGGIIWYRKR